MDTLDRLYQKGVSRRNFLVGAGAAGAVTALAGCDNGGAFATGVSTLTDADILTFALNLEYLEAEFYLYAATGAGLSATDAGTGAGTTTVPATTKLTGLTTAQQNILNEIAFDELSHVQYLRKALVTPVARPALDLTFFSPLAAAANTITPVNTTVAPSSTAYNPVLIPTGFTPYASFDAFLVGAFIFEDVGVTAYNGAAPFFSNPGSNNALLVAAAGVLAVEAYHAAYVRTVLTANAINSAPTPTNGTTTYLPFYYARSVQNLLAALSGTSTFAETLLTIPSTVTPAVGSTPASTLVRASTIVNATAANALAYTRTTDQVHHVVYGSATVGVGKGGFFPNGTNFKFSVTTS